MADYHKVEAVIRNEKLEEVKFMLMKNGFLGMTVTKAEGIGEKKGIYKEDFERLLPRARLEIIVTSEPQAVYVRDLIAESAKTGNLGDGIVYYYKINDVTQIRTGKPYP